MSCEEGVDGCGLGGVELLLANRRKLVLREMPAAGGARRAPVGLYLPEGYATTYGPPRNLTLSASIAR